MDEKYDFKILICFLDEFNGDNIFAIRNLNPRKVVFIYEDIRKYKDLYEDIKEYIWKVAPFTYVDGETLEKISQDNISRIIHNYPKGDIIVNLSGGDKLYSLLAYRLCIIGNYKVIYADLEKEEIYELTNTDIESLQRKEEKLNIKDFIESSGGKIDFESTNLFNDKNIQDAIDFIISNYDVWARLKAILRSENVLSCSKDYPFEVAINITSIRDPYKYKIFMDKALELGLFKVHIRNKDGIVLKFNSLEYKSFVTKAGTWLEALVYKIICSLKGIDDVRAGVMFQWDNDDDRVRNEVDILVSAVGEITYISCKDTSKYDEADLNEIEVYANKIGGDAVKKVLVSTIESYKETTELRAFEMGIKLVIFKGDIIKLKNRLNNIIFS